MSSLNGRVARCGIDYARLRLTHRLEAYATPVRCGEILQSAWLRGIVQASQKKAAAPNEPPLESCYVAVRDYAVTAPFRA